MTTLTIIGIYLAGVVAAWVLTAVLNDKFDLKGHSFLIVTSWMAVIILGAVVLILMCDDLPTPSLKIFKRNRP